jgi:hypothetical protein
VERGAGDALDAAALRVALSEINTSLSSLVKLHRLTVIALVVLAGADKALGYLA